MNRVWAIKAEQRLTQLEQRTKEQAEAIARLLAALETKPRVGRPPKDDKP